MTIRLIVGPARAGIGYGVYGIIGNLMATLVPLVGGMVMVSGETEADGQDMVCWYFAGLVRCSCFAQHAGASGTTSRGSEIFAGGPQMVLGTMCWAGVRVIEGGRCLLDMPADQVVETDDVVLQQACLSMVVGEKSYRSLVQSTDTTGKAAEVGTTETVQSPVADEEGED